MLSRILEFSKMIPKQAMKPWAPFALAFIAFSDYFIFIIPLDALVIATLTAAPQRWLAISFWTTMGNIAGITGFAEVLRIYGQPLVEQWIPNLMTGEIATVFSHWLQNYGYWALIASSALPIAQHPIVAVATLAKVPTLTIVISMFIGRFFKYAVYTWLVKHARRGLEKFWKP